MRKPKDWGQPCPNPDCSHYRLMHRGNVSAISTYMTQSGKRRIFCCSKCARPFSETRDTVFFDLRTPEEKVMMALKMLLVKVALSDISFVLGVTEETVLEWLRRAAQKAHEINVHLLRDLPVTQVQLDEMWSFIRRKHAQQADPDGESPALSEDGRQWVWISFAPEFRLILAAFVGPRTFASALQLIQMTAAVVLGVPCFFSDGFSCYLSALIEVYHTLKTFPHTGKPGRPQQPVKEPLPDLVYGQVVKKKRQGRLQELVYRVRCGAKRLEELGLSISTSLIERLNLTLRHALAPLVRKSWSFCKDRSQMRRRVVFFQAFYNFARPHMSLRVPLPDQALHATGLIQPKWHHRTPGMAAGLTNHVWTFRELLTAKFEPLHNQSGSG
jgi:IS1 family transposase/transposase-like protein